MNVAVLDLGERHRTFPKSVQPGIPKLGPLKAGWTRVKISELFQVVNRPCQLSDGETYRLVTVKRSRGGIESRGDLKGAEIAVKSQFYIEADDFLISKRQIVHGACAIVSAEYSGSIVSNEYAVLRCRPALDMGFLRQLIHSIYFQETCFHASLGVHVEKMIFSTPEWFKRKIDIPALDEQRRIADFLGAVDERTKLLQRRRDALAQYKTGLMQRLFDQSLRFTRDDGTAFPDWEEKRLEQVAEINPRTGPLPDEFEYIDLESVTNGQLASTMTFRSHDAPERAQRVVNNSDILFQSVRPYQKNNLYFECGGNYVASTGYAQIRAQVNSRFLFQQLLTEKFVREVIRRCTGSSYPAINSTDLAEIPVGVPDLDEQRKIADALGAVDDKIVAVSAQVDQMQAFKKGLLQQMFI